MDNGTMTPEYRLKLRPDPRLPGLLSQYLSEDSIAEMAVPSYFHWNPLVRWIISERLRVILECAGFDPSDNVLDFGTGTGVLLQSLSPAVSQVLATDLRTEAVRCACRLLKLQNVRVLELEEFWGL